MKLRTADLKRVGGGTTLQADFLSTSDNTRTRTLQLCFVFRTKFVFLLSTVTVF